MLYAVYYKIIKNGLVSLFAIDFKSVYTCISYVYYKLTKNSLVILIVCGLRGVLVTHCFRTNGETDKDIEEVLLSLSGKKKSAFIKDAIRFYMKYNEIISRIDSNVSEILNMLKSGSFHNDCISTADDSVPNEEKQKNSEVEEILQDSIMSLIDF